MLVQETLDAFCGKLIHGQTSEFGIKILVQNGIIAGNRGGFAFADFISFHPFFGILFERWRRGDNLNGLSTKKLLTTGRCKNGVHDLISQLKFAVAADLLDYRCSVCILRILAEQRSIVVFGREVLRDVLMIGVIDIKRFDVMAQPSAHLCLDVGIAVMDDHRVEVFVVDVDGSFVCGVDEQKINIRRNALGFEDDAADGELFFAHFAKMAFITQYAKCSHMKTC